ncbi:MAG: serine protease, partial [Pseudomonadota bacterium]
MRILLVSAFALVLPIGASAQNLQTISAEAELSTARVITKTGRGSGFAVGKGQNGTFYVVTNNHVIEGHRDAIVAFGLKDRVVGYAAKVINASAEMDLAILHVFPKGSENHSVPLVPLATREINKGEEVFALGFPGSTDFWVGDKTSPDAFETTLTRGVVSKVSTGSWGGQSMQIELVLHTATINKGNSGGPLFNYCGQVMGVNTAGLIQANDNYVSSSSNTLAGFLRGSNIPFST